jgi:hypothetical protein
MMQAWADQEEQKHDLFSKRGNVYNNNRQGNDHRNYRTSGTT